MSIRLGSLKARRSLIVVGSAFLSLSPLARAEAEAESGKKGKAGTALQGKIGDRDCVCREAAGGVFKCACVDAAKDAGPASPTAPTAPKDELDAEALEALDARKRAAEKASEPQPGPEDEHAAFRIGLSAAIGLPHPLSYSLDLKFFELVSLSAVYARSTSPEIQGMRIQSSATGGVLRLHPFRGPFFFGAGYGTQTIGLESRQKIKPDGDEAEGKDGEEVVFSYELRSSYATPMIGWMARFDSGIVLGFELGYQRTLGAERGEVSAKVGDGEEPPAGGEEYDKAMSEATRRAEALETKGLPYVTLLRLGWML